MFLHYLPLRPSTLEILTKAGFEHVQEVVASRNEGGGLANFAAELGIASNNIEQAHEIYNEITELLIDASTNGNNNDKDEENYKNNCDNNNSRRRRPLVIANKKPKTAVELLQQHTTNNNSGSGSTTSNSTTGTSSIITFCRAIDTILHGGIPLGQGLTELSGCPGSGKTALAQQLAVNTCGLPKFIGGVGGGVGGSGTRSQTIYIDTEGSFSSERCYTMAKSLISHIQNGLLKKRNQQKHTINSNSSNNTGNKWNCTPEDILRSIHVFRVHDVSELETVLYGSIPHMLMNAINNNNIKLIVIDSIAFPFRSAAASASDNTDYYITRTRKLTQISHKLNLWSTKYNLAVLAINQMTTKKIILMGNNNDNNNTTCTQHKLVPALGESWAHSVTIRLELSISTSSITTTVTNTVTGEQQQQEQQQSNNNSTNSNFIIQNNNRIRRYCKLTKSPCLPTTGELAEFQIVESGIRGV